MAKITFTFEEKPNKDGKPFYDIQAVADPKIEPGENVVDARCFGMAIVKMGLRE